MLMCGVGPKSVVHLMKFHLLQWEVIKVKFLINSNIILTVLNLHQKTDPKVAVFALERDFASLYTLWGELSQNQLTNASVLSLPGETLKTDGRNSSIIGSDDLHISS